jgi:hypothetical protein
VSATGLSPPAYVRRTDRTMNPNEIELVVSLFGPKLNAQNLPVQPERWPSNPEPAHDSAEGRRALSLDPRLGWRFAQQLAKSGDTVTLAKVKEIGWISAAVEFLTTKGATANSSDEFHHVEMAEALDHGETGRVLRACLLAVDVSVERVAAAFKLAEESVSAYHSLFFNVIGRRNDIEFIHRLEDMHHSVSFAREQGGLAGGDPLLAVARIGTVEDVLVAAGIRPAEEMSPAALVETLQHGGLAAAAEWFKIPGNANKEIAPFVALGLDVAKRVPLPAETAGLHAYNMGDLFSAQLDEDAENVRLWMELKAAASSSGPAA